MKNRQRAGNKHSGGKGCRSRLPAGPKAESGWSNKSGGGWPALFAVFSPAGADGAGE